jgi:LysM repeat protein
MKSDKPARSMGKFLSAVAVLFLMMVFTPALAFSFAVRDSIGVEKVGQRFFILHKVEPKETLYSLSRRYKVSVADIVAQNPSSEDALSIGEVLKIPFEKGVEKNSVVDKSAGKLIHNVEVSETLFAISRKYNVSVDEIKKWNGLTDNHLNAGQQLIIHTKANDISKSSNKLAVTKEEKTLGKKEERNLKSDEKNVRSGKGKSVIEHEVEPSQTLFSISRMYEVTVDDIKTWNGLTGNDISIGQKLKIEKEGVQQAAVKKEEHQQQQVIITALPAPVLKPDVADSGKKTENEAKISKKDRKAEEEKDIRKQSFESYESSMKKITRQGSGKEDPDFVGEDTNFKKIVEVGLAEVIEGSYDTQKFLALHRTAPVGTIMQVRNEMNNLSVFVRVVGKLPDTGANDKVLVKISKTAFDKLSSVNSKFPVEVIYTP